jgi:hypothetical protein
VAVAKTIHRLLTHEGYSVRGVAKVLEAGAVVVPVPVPQREPPAASLVEVGPLVDQVMLADLRAMRDELTAALGE